MAVVQSESQQTSVLPRTMTAFTTSFLSYMVDTGERQLVCVETSMARSTTSSDDLTTRFPPTAKILLTHGKLTEPVQMHLHYLIPALVLVHMRNRLKRNVPC